MAKHVNIVMLMPGEGFLQHNNNHMLAQVGHEQATEQQPVAVVIT